MQDYICNTCNFLQTRRIKYKVVLNWWVLTMHWQSLPKTFKTHWPAGLVVCLKVLALLKKITDPTFFIARVTLHWKYVLHKKLKNTHQYQSLLSLIYDKVERQCKHLKNILHVRVCYIENIYQPIGLHILFSLSRPQNSQALVFGPLSFREDCIDMSISIHIHSKSCTG